MLRLYVDDFPVFPPCLMRNGTRLDGVTWPQRLEHYTGVKPCLSAWGDSGFLGLSSGIDVCSAYAKFKRFFVADGASGSYAYNLKRSSAPLTKQFGLRGRILRSGRGGNKVLYPSDLRAIGDAPLHDLGAVLS